MKKIVLLLFIFKVSESFKMEVKKKEEGKIVGGYKTEPGQFAWTTGVWANGGQFCGGAIINKEWVLTAAHCLSLFQPQNLEVHIGDHNVAELNEDWEVVRKVKTFHIHPGYDESSPTNLHDIALLHLDTPVKSSEKLVTIPLPTTDVNLADGTDVITSGWGVTTYLGEPSPVKLAANLKIVGRKVCKEAYAFIEDFHVCASGPGIDACQGDSGGPLWVSIDEHPTLVGIVSTGYKCAEPGFPGVYTRVSTHMEWIKKYVPDFR